MKPIDTDDAPILVDLDEAFAASLADFRLSRSERQALSQTLASLGRQTDAKDLRRRALAAARAVIHDPANAPLVLDWLEDVNRVIEGLAAPTSSPHAHIAEAHFSPGESCRNRIGSLLRASRNTVDICVFTITDDRISEPILEAHSRGVKLRILSDNEKAEDLGSDIPRFREAGIPVRIDHSPAHMHHKFAVFDAGLLLTGSYNWTRGAAAENEENLIVTSDARHVSAFSREFERLWNSLG
ncbi:MAG: phospholipase D-like domain-containing protein [Isosphaeraceae bacterium]